MATKKQKRAAAEAKHERFMAELKRTGLEAQEADRQRREEQKARNVEDALRRERKKKVSLNEILEDMMDECV